MSDRLNIIVTCLLLLLLLSCNSDKDCIVDKNLNNKTLDYFINIKGTASNEKEFILTNHPYEYQYSLLNHFPDIEKNPILIRELIWTISPTKKTVVWFYKKDNEWISVDNLTWNPLKIQF